MREASPMDISIPPAPERRRIVIIGGGFSGAVTALNLLHKLGPNDASVTIIEPRACLGAGLAYSAPDPNHRVNVSAVRLLVLPDQPGLFDAWLRASGLLEADPAALLPDGRAFPSRAVFGAYLNGVLRERAAAPGTAPFTHIAARATRIAHYRDGYEITLDSGASLAADIIVLAVSHPPPGVPRPVRAIAGAKKFIADPWVKGALDGIAATDRVLIIGTALSTADAVATLHAAGHAGGIVAVSRRGLVSRLRAVVPKENFGDFASNPSRSAASLVRRVRTVIAQAKAQGSCWEAVIERIREQGTQVWAALPDAERARFLRHARPYWDVHRYQLAPQLGALCAAKTATGQLRMIAARIIAAAPDGDGFAVTLRHRHAPEGETDLQKFDAIVNCTGPDHTRVIETNPALASLAAAGLVQPDRFGLGLQTDTSARALDIDGNPVDTILVAGPLARAAFGELMGLPQVSLHAAFVAGQVLRQLAPTLTTT